MSMTSQSLRSMSGKQLLDLLAYKTNGKEPQPLPESYLNCVRWEIQRRKKKAERRK